MNELGKRIAVWRGERTYRDAAKELGCDHTTLFYLESGQRLPGLRIRRALKRKAGIDVKISRSTSIELQ